MKFTLSWLKEHLDTTASVDEIAETLDLPLGTVKTYIHRARAELKESLAPLRE